MLHYIILYYSIVYYYEVQDLPAKRPASREFGDGVFEDVGFEGNRLLTLNN